MFKSGLGFVFAAFSLTQAFAPSSAHAASPPPIEDFAAAPLMRTARLSPNGTRIAAVLNQPNGESI
ncbi:MAG TPA: hypothetical protein VGE47_17645, partial [Burkholderiaceae bacterium]